MKLYLPYHYLYKCLILKGFSHGIMSGFKKTERNWHWTQNHKPLTLVSSEWPNIRAETSVILLLDMTKKCGISLQSPIYSTWNSVIVHPVISVWHQGHWSEVVNIQKYQRPQKWAACAHTPIFITNVQFPVRTHIFPLSWVPLCTRPHARYQRYKHKLTSQSFSAWPNEGRKTCQQTNHTPKRSMSPWKTRKPRRLPTEEVNK